MKCTAGVRSATPAVIVLAIGILGVGCRGGDEVVLGPDTEPRLHHRPGHGGGPGGGDDDGGDTQSPLRVTFSNRAGDRITSGWEYVNDVCGIDLTFSLNDLRLEVDGLKGGERRDPDCQGDRSIQVEFPSGEVRQAGFLNVDGVEFVQGTNELRKAQFNGAGCNILDFDPESTFHPDNGSDKVLVSFDDNGTADEADDFWIVKTQEDPDGDGVNNDLAFCEDDGQLYPMPFELRLDRTEG